MGKHFSNELFHFVGQAHPTNEEKNFTILVKVLNDGWISHPPHKREWGATSLTLDLDKSLLTGQMVVPEMVCFCDIPLEHLGGHIEKYGRFGLSLNKDYAVRYGARPVTYFPMHDGDKSGVYGSPEILDFEAAYKGFVKHILHSHGDLPGCRTLTKIAETPLQAVTAVDSMFKRGIFAYVKVFNADLAEDDPDYFYAEKEWRRLGNIGFSPAEVQHVVVAPGFAGRLSKPYPLTRGRLRNAPEVKANVVLWLHFTARLGRRNLVPRTKYLVLRTARCVRRTEAGSRSTRY